MNDDILKWTPDLMLEIRLNEPEDFLRVKETLTRIGIEGKVEKQTLYQSCHILHKQGCYFIVHFKEMFELDGKMSNLTEGDLGRRNTIATLLSDWGLIDIVNPLLMKTFEPMNRIKVITHADKKFWDLRSKYKIGRCISKR